MNTVRSAFSPLGAQDGSLTRPSLLRRLRDGANAEAWNQFVELYTPLIDAYCRKCGLQAADAADVAQEVMLAVARAITSFEYDPQRGRFRDWLRTVMRSKLNNFLARRQRQPVEVGPSTIEYLVESTQEPVLSDDAWDQEYARRLFQWASAQARLEVSESTWQAFAQTALEERSGQEVATRLGLSVGAVYIAKSRVLARIKQLLATLENEPIDWNQVPS